MQKLVNDGSNIKGFVDIVVKDNGVVVQEINRCNLVVTQGRVEECHIIAGDDTANRVITYLAVGEGGWTVDEFTPVPPSMSDVALEDEYPSEGRKAITSHSYPISTTVEFYTILTETECNTAHLTEAGLFCLNGSLFARITYEVIPKTATRTVEYYWRIIF